MSKKRHKKIRKKGMPPGTLIYTGHRAPNPSHLLTVVFTQTDYSEQVTYTVPDSRQNGITWTDVRSLSDAVLIEQIGNDFQLHPLALEDVLDTQQRAKLEEYDNGLFIILHNLRFDPVQMELQSEQISIFMGLNFVVSFQEDPDDTFHGIRKRAEENAGRIRKKGVDYLTYTLLDLVVDNYYTVLDDMETVLQELESSLHDQGFEPVSKARIYDLKRVLSQFRHRVLPLRDAAMRFYRTDCPYVEESNRPYLRDLMDHVTQILDAIDNYRDILSGVEALYQAEIGNRLNNVMRLLTIISTIFIPLSFIAGVYGMNFDNMPELHWHYGYFIMLGLMLMASLSMLYYFRRNRWI